jgi:hypothetical protein
MFQPSDETVNMREGKKDDPLPIGWFALFTPDDAMPKDRGLHVKRRGLIIIFGLIVVIAAWGAGQSGDFVENVFASGFGQSIGRGLATVTGVLPTSVAEAFLFLSGAWFLVIGIRAAWHVARRKRRAVNAIACGGLHFGAFAAVMLALFYVTWGLNYFRAPLIERQGWSEHARPGDKEAETELLHKQCLELVDATNASYLVAMGSEDYGEPSAPPTEWSNIDNSIDAGFEQVQAELGLDESFAASRGRAKPVALAPLMDYLQISGFYFPWTGEANYNRQQPPCSVPFVIAHEKAHQRCITSEDEANFFGFLACTRSDDAYVRYSGYLFAQRQLLSELMRIDEPRGVELLKRRYPGVQRDVDSVRQYWERFETGVAGEVGKASHAVNDAYLTANQVEGGIESYRMSAKLLIVYARKKGGLMPAAKSE